MDPAEVTHSPSSRMTPRQDLDTATATVSWVSDHLRPLGEFAVMPVPYRRPLTFLPVLEYLSGRGDLNSCSLDPQSSALTKLAHVPPRHRLASGGACPPSSGGSASLAQPRRIPEQGADPRHIAARRAAAGA